ncbi:MAG: FtsX-like permease family protein, partial [Acidobacteria bacterium]|nr:FtsX-like permease family protein [Acidobacteriota bacterium]
AQAFLLGIIGSIAGVGLGFVAQSVFPSFLSDYFDVEIELVLSIVPALQGLAVGLLTTLLFTIPPLLAISKIRPALILRRDMHEKGGKNRGLTPVLISRGQTPIVPAPPPIFPEFAALAAIAVGIWGIAIWMSGSLRIGSYFAGGLVVSIAALAAIARGLLFVLNRFMNRFSAGLSPVLRQGIANLYRPGTHVTAVLVALGVGVMFTLCVQLLQDSLLEQLRFSAPPDSPNVFLINITDRDRDELWELIRSQDGVLQAPAPSPAVAGQLTSINSTPVEQLEFTEGEQRYFRTQFALTWSDEVPKATEILDGSWWPAGSEEALVSVEENVADALRLKVDDRLEWSVAGRLLSARIANLRRTDAVRIGANNQFILTRSALRGFPVIYTGTVRMRPSAVSALQRVVFDRFPTVTVVNAADVLEIVQQVVDRISLTVRFLSAFAIVGGVIILASAVAGTRYRRMREVAILKTVGATRRKVIQIFSLEFLIIGLAAGLMGSILAAFFSLLLIERLFNTIFAFDVLPLILAIASTAAIAVAAGWAASFRILEQKPLEVLRQADL